MKLRNKHTGEVEEFNEIYLTKTVKETNTATSEYVERSYYGIDELNEEWEGCKPKEPLIKDEKIRKAVRAWAEANRVAEVRYSSCHDAECEFNARDDENKSIVFIGNFTEMNEELAFSGRTIYTIAELCGDEE